jgi:prepilin signal peptidase PulO-like enzyme (type II secretory pathway)
MIMINILAIHGFIFLLGLLVGSFLNVVALRVAGGESIRGRSRCRSCKGTLHPISLIPVISWIVQKGRCAMCRERISVQYPLVELVTALLFLALWQHFAGELILFVGFAGVFSFLIALFVTDARFGVLPDILTIPAIVLTIATFLGAALLDGLFGLSAFFTFLGVFVPSIAIGGGFFALQWLLSRGRWVGSGDIRLGVLMGTMLPIWRELVLALFIAYIVGAVVGVVLLITKRATRTSAIPFGPYLIIGTGVAFFWGTHILHWYGTFL